MIIKWLNGVLGESGSYKRKEQIYYCLLAVIVIVGIIISASSLSGRTSSDKYIVFGIAGKDAMANQVLEIVEDIDDIEEVEEEDAPEEIEEEIAYVSVIDFEALWEMNEDIYAWVTIPGTDIDYPILQHPTDNIWYLNNNLDGSHGYPGCIYTENLNSKDFMDPNTVIYGHNMKNGTMFAGLHKFRTKDFFEEYNEVIIYLPDKTLYYEVFAAYIFDDRHLMYSFDFFDLQTYSSFIESVFNIQERGANINRDMEVGEQDKIITLSTCVSGQDTKRLLVHAVLKES